jgi:nucleoid-associated protein YgaU
MLHQERLLQEGEGTTAKTQSKKRGRENMGLFDYVKGKILGTPSTPAAPPGRRNPPEPLKKEGPALSRVEIKPEVKTVVPPSSAAPAVEAENSAPAAMEPAVVASSQSDAHPGDVTNPKLYTVQPGDSLWKIAETEYGHGHGDKYHKIFEANKSLLSNPDEIYPGQVLRIPPLAD